MMLETGEKTWCGFGVSANSNAWFDSQKHLGLSPAYLGPGAGAYARRFSFVCLSVNRTWPDLFLTEQISPQSKHKGI